MSLWLVRGGRNGEHEELALETGMACIRFYEAGDLSQATSKEAMLDLVRKAYPNANEGRVKNVTGQLFAFAQRIKEGDLVVMPMKIRPQVAIGRVRGPYSYRTDLGQVYHTRSVEWIRPDVPRTRFGQDLLYSLGAFMTVCQIQRNNAEERVKAILAGGVDPGAAILPGEGAREGQDSEIEAPPDVEQLARDQILRHLEQRFKGHELARLVDAVLRAEGYLTQLSDPGPDGGVDILAGRGSLGFDGPKLCVQVKSSDAPADVTILRALLGTMSNFKADQGLLVSWGGFNRAVEKEARLSFFSVRLWGADALVEAIFRNYERLSEELQSELPLKRMWGLVLEE